MMRFRVYLWFKRGQEVELVSEMIGEVDETNQNNAFH